MEASDYEGLIAYRFTGDGYNVILSDYKKVRIDLDVSGLGIDLARAIDELGIRLPVLRIERDGNGRYKIVLVNDDVLVWPEESEEEFYLSDAVVVQMAPDAKPEMPDDLTAVDGIGSAYARRLNNVGIWTIAQLLFVDAETTAAEIGVSVEVVRGWQGDARENHT